VKKEYPRHPELLVSQSLLSRTPTNLILSVLLEPDMYIHIPVFSY
jgi:hypothetical protein